MLITAYHNSQRPEPSLMPEDLNGIQDKHDHDDGECQWIHIRWNTQGGTIQEAE